MFLRMYAGILLAFVLSLLLSYSYYQYSKNQRLADYQSRQLRGVIQLISKNANALANEAKKQQYVDLAAKLLGARVNHHAAASALDIDQRQALRQEGALLLLPKANKQLQWWFSTGSNRYASLTFAELTEQKYRGMASLLVAELAKLQWPNALDAITPYTAIPLAFSTIDEAPLDQSQKQRLRRGSIVVEYNKNNNLQLEIYTPTNDEQILVLGPIQRFNTLPWSVVLHMVLLIVSIITATTMAMIFLLQQRFERVITAVDQYGAGDLNTRVNMPGQDILAQLSQRFDSMTSQIQSLLENRQNLLQAVSHELRTPLAKMKFRLQVLEDDNNSNHQTLQALHNDINQLEALVNEVMAYQRLADKSPTLSPTNINPLIREEMTSWQELYPKIRIELDLDNDSLCEAHAPSLKRLLTNLFSNACKHSNGQIKVATRTHGNTLKLYVEDNGAGIPPSEWQTVFDAFYRVDASRNKNTGGYGLGLAIVKRIAESHHASISVGNSTALGGACFTVTLKASQ